MSRRKKFTEHTSQIPLRGVVGGPIPLNSAPAPQQLADPKCSRQYPSSTPDGLPTMNPHGPTSEGVDNSMCVGNRVYDNSTMSELGTVVQADYRPQAGWRFTTDMG